jgi:hypothetical protein
MLEKNCTKFSGGSMMKNAFRMTIEIFGLHRSLEKNVFSPDWI